MISYSIAEDRDLSGILELQTQNLKINLQPNEIEREGFVTVVHTIELLRKMNAPYPHIIAKSDQEVVGYALVMQKEMAIYIPILSNLFKQLKTIRIKEMAFENYAFFVMGQICISKDYRKKGLFKGLYTEMKARMKKDFDYVVTEVAIENSRSLNAHHAAGFTTIKEYKAEDGRSWAIVALDLNE